MMKKFIDGCVKIGAYSIFTEKDEGLVQATRDSIVEGMDKRGLCYYEVSASDFATFVLIGLEKRGYEPVITINDVATTAARIVEIHVPGDIYEDGFAIVYNLNEENVKRWRGKLCYFLEVNWMV